MVDFGEDFDVMAAEIGWFLADQSKVLGQVAKVDGAEFHRHAPLVGQGLDVSTDMAGKDDFLDVYGGQSFQSAGDPVGGHEGCDRDRHDFNQGCKAGFFREFFDLSAQRRFCESAGQEENRGLVQG